MTYHVSIKTNNEWVVLWTGPSYAEAQSVRRDVTPVFPETRCEIKRKA